MKKMLPLFVAAALAPPISTAETRVIGGDNAADGSWPFQVELNVAGGQCGGTLVHPRWVLTAAHCFSTGTETVDVTMGRRTLSDTSVGQKVRAKRNLLHPAWNKDTMDSDVALVELPDPVSYPLVKLMGQTVDLDNLAAGTVATAVGWGRTVNGDANSSSDILKQVQLPIVDNAVCQTVQKAGLTRNMMCAGYAEGGKDTCQGDSGGPLLVQGGDGSWTEVGVTSFGQECAAPNTYGVYARVSNFAQWISSQICSVEEIPGAPQLAVTLEGNRATASFAPVPNATGYRLYYAPANAGMSQVSFLDIGSQTTLSVELPSGAHFNVAVMPNNNNCLGPISNVAQVLVP